MRTERWSTIGGVLGSYEVSSTGKVKNITTEYNLRGGTGYGGYRKVRLKGSDGSDNYKMVHVLVAEVFLPRPSDPERTYVHHVDGNRNNNHMDNLEWVTRKENNNRKVHARHGDKFRPVLQIDKDGTVINRFPSLESVPYGTSMIWRCCKGRVSSAHGYSWKYEDSFDLPGEIWKNLSFSGRNIRVSSRGRVETNSGLRTYGGKIFSGYRTVIVGKKGVFVHRLVCMAFHKNPAKKSKVVHHKNGVRDDNRSLNLAWFSSSENLMAATRGNIHPRKCPVVQKNMSGIEIAKYNSVHEAAKSVGIHPSHISAVCKGGRISAAGFKWEYIVKTSVSMGGSSEPQKQRGG